MEKQTVSIPGIEKSSFDITIEGLSPFLSNNIRPKIEEVEKRQQGRASQKKGPKDPQAEYESGFYYTEGRYGVLATAIKQSCVSACRFLDMAMTEARGGFFVMGNVLPFDEGTGEPVMSVEPVRVGRGALDIRYRPMFWPWFVTFRVLHNPRVITQESIVNIVETAGFHIGIGDWRPEKNGNYGMFQVMRE
jgi:hypothetical protein